MTELDWFASQSLEVWYDKQIRPGTTWADELAAAIDSSAFLVFFVSGRSVTSKHCLNEIAYALDSGKHVLAIYLEAVELQGGLRLSMSRTQAILRWQLTEDEYRGQLRIALMQISERSASPGPPVDMLAHGSVRAVRNIWRVPLQRSQFFSGRDGIIDDIREQFATADRPIVVALTGLGGVGKSQLALEYIHRHQKDKQVVAWIRAESRASIESDIVTLAGDLGLSEANSASMTRVIAALHAWFALNDSWFLVLDNVENPDTLDVVLPGERRGHVLVTTRYQGWSSLARPIPVAPFGTAEARDFLLTRAGDRDEKSAVKLAELLGGLPLALEEACAYIESTGRSLASYLELFESHHRELLSRSRPIRDYPATLQSTWDMSFMKLEQAADPATGLLKLLAYLGPDDVPEALLLDHDLAEKSELPAKIWLDDCMASLRRYSLIKVDHAAISVHRLVQLVTRDRMPAAEQQAYALKALQLVESAFPPSAAVGDQLPDCSRLLPHALATLAHAAEMPEADVYAGRLLGRTGTYLCSRGAIQDGVARIEKAYKLFLNRDTASVDFAHACEIYGRVKYQAGLLQEARDLVQESIRTLDALADPGHAMLPQSLALLAWISWSAGDLELARRSAERAAQIIAQQSSGKDPRILSGQSVLGRVLMDSGKTVQALETANECVSIIGLLGGARRPIMCGAFLHISQVLQHCGFPLRARAWADESLALGVPAYGEHHPLVAGAHCVMGQVLMDLGEIEAATGQFESTIANVRRSPTLVSEHSAIAYSHLINALVEIGRANEADSLLVEYRTMIKEKIAGESSLACAHASLAAARLSHACKDIENALMHLDSADQTIRARYGDRHVYRLPCLLVAARIQRDSSAVDQAQATLELALTLLHDGGLDEHPWASACLSNQAELFDQVGKTLDANDKRLKAVAILSKATGPSSRATLAHEQEVSLAHQMH